MALSVKKRGAQSGNVALFSRFVGGSTTSTVNKAGSLRVRERYLSSDLTCPFQSLQGREFDSIIVPTGSSLDVYIQAFEKAPCGKRVFLLLGSVLERLALEGKVNTLAKCKERIASHPSTIYFANQFYRQDSGDLLGTVIDTLMWLRLHLEQHKLRLPVVVLSENDEFIKLAKSKHFQVFRGLEFFQAITDLPLDVLDMASSLAAAFEEGSSSSNQMYAPLWSQRRLEESLQAGSAVAGVVQMSSADRSGPCTLKREGALPDLHINITDMNRAIHGDQVVVSESKVVGILKRNWRPYVVSLSTEDRERVESENSKEKQMHLICVPLDPRIPKIRVTTRQPTLLVGQRFVVVIDDWAPHSRYPQGHFVRTLGTIGDIATESLTILVETGLEEHLNDFSPRAMSCLPLEGHRWTVSAKDAAVRRDFRPCGEDTLIFSVDPPGCQDIDDAMSFELIRTENGSQLARVGVHIADVTWFVESQSALDVEASKRATSVYLQDRRLDMLPRLLCEDLCSLRPHIDRFAVSVVWTLWLHQDKQGSYDKYTVEDIWMGRSVIRSAHALSYSQAQRLLDGLDPGAETSPEYAESHTGKAIEPKLHAPIRAALQGLERVAHMRHMERDKHGALSLQSGEFKFSLDASHKPSAILSKKALPIHGTVAELMIMANEQVAREIVKHHPQAAVVRRHANPPAKKLAVVLELAKEAGMELDTSSNHALAQSMAIAREKLDATVFAVINDALTRAMSEAEYVCAGLVSDFTHFGLGLEFYTHFTSPIRRYADVLVHRLLLNSKRMPSEQQSADDEKPVQEDLAPQITQEWSNTVKSTRADEDLLFGSVLGGEALGLEVLNDDPFAMLEDQGDLFGDSLDAIGMGKADVSDSDLFLSVPRNDEIQSSSLNAIQTIGKQAQGQEELSMQPELAEHINKMHRAAKEASYRSSELFFSLYFQRNPQAVQGIVVDIRDHGLTCFVPAFQTKFLIRAANGHCLSVCWRDENGLLHLDEEHEATMHFIKSPGVESAGKGSSGGLSRIPEYSGVTVSSPSIPVTSIKVLDRIWGYIDCPQEWKTRIPKPKLFLFFPGSDSIQMEEDEVSPKPFKEFAREHSPKSMVESSTSTTPAVAAKFASRRESRQSLYHRLSQEGRWKQNLSTVPSSPCAQTAVERLARGRFRFGGFSPREEQKGEDEDEYGVQEQEGVEEEDWSGTSFSSIQHDKRQVEQYVAKVSREATRRIDRLLAAKRETRVKNKLKGSK